MRRGCYPAGHSPPSLSQRRFAMGVACTVVRFFRSRNQTYIVSPDCWTPGHCTLVKLEARGTVDDGNLGRNLSDCPSLQGTQCRGVPSSYPFWKGDRRRACSTARAYSRVSWPSYRSAEAELRQSVRRSCAREALSTCWLLGAPTVTPAGRCTLLDP